MKPDFKDHFSIHSRNYALYRPGYPEGLFGWLADVCEDRELALDCGTGSGQCALQLSPYFKKILGIDPSEAQIVEARKAQQNPSFRNVEFEVSPAEKTPCGDGSVSLISVAQAIHWFDHARFFQEAFRILKPGGVLAAWGYGHHSVSGCEETMERFYHEVVGPYWPPERESIENRYQDIERPSWVRQNEIPPPDLRMEANWNRHQLLGYISTWSAIEKYRSAKGTDPVQLLEESLEQCWPHATEVRLVRWPIFFIAARKS